MGTVKENGKLDPTDKVKSIPTGPRRPLETSKTYSFRVAIAPGKVVADGLTVFEAIDLQQELLRAAEIFNVDTAVFRVFIQRQETERVVHYWEDYNPVGTLIPSDELSTSSYEEPFEDDYEEEPPTEDEKPVWGGSRPSYVAFDEMTVGLYLGDEDPYDRELAEEARRARQAFDEDRACRREQCPCDICRAGCR
jgi:hypothetical protein